MNKNYKKIYEIGSNRYYILHADDELFLATETNISISRTFKFLGTKKMTQGLKLLKVSTPIAILFSAIAEIKPDNHTSDTTKDMFKYKKVNSKTVRENIILAYSLAAESQKAELYQWYTKMREEVKNSLKSKGKTVSKKEVDEKTAVFYRRYKESVEVVDRHNPIGSTILTIIDNSDPIVRGMQERGLHHLITEKINSFAANIYMYEQDTFGKVTIYQLITAKGVVKTVNTFIYDHEIIDKFLQSVYEADTKIVA